jgi:L-cysteine desulfidase
MSKFLKLVESNTPEIDIDLETQTKRELQRYLMSKDISVSARVFKNQIDITLPTKTVVSLTITDVRQPAGEENQEEEAISPLIKAISDIKDTDNPKIKQAQVAIDNKVSDLTRALQKR